MSKSNPPIKQAIENSYAELETFFKDTTFEQYQKKVKFVPSVTNINLKFKNSIIRYPRKEFAIFFNRKNEYHNIREVNKHIEMVDLPLYFNQETGLMVNRLTSPEIFITDSFINEEYIHKAVKSLNNINGYGIQGETAFDFNVAFAFFKTIEQLDHYYIDWAQDFYNNFFLRSSNARIEFSHNDPDMSNFTITNKVIDYEFSSMAPVLSDLCNLYALYSTNDFVKKYLLNINAPKRQMEPLIIYWSLFWGMWGLSKEEESVPDFSYTRKAAKRYDLGKRRLRRYLESG